MLYEKIYVEENKSEKIQRYQQKIDSDIIGRENKRYILALAVREELYKNYNYNIVEMQKMTKRLVRKYNKKHQSEV